VDGGSPINKIPALPKGVSPLRQMMAEARGAEHLHCGSLDEARQTEDAVLVMEGDDGGRIYLTCPARRVRCDEATLRRLLEDVDALGWRDISMAGLFFELLAMGSGVAGGMGGGVILDGLWVHPRIDGDNLPAWLTRRQLIDEIEAVLGGESDRIKTVMEGSLR
jgi:hypothetical protein